MFQSDADNGSRMWKILGIFAVIVLLVVVGGMVMKYLRAEGRAAPEDGSQGV